MSFDPYYQWLGIAPTEQPPNHYQLLGLELFEENSNVIENAADRQMAFIRSVQSGQHQAESQQLLNEIAIARRVLLEPHSKLEYDHSLRPVDPVVNAELIAEPPATSPQPPPANPERRSDRACERVPARPPPAPTELRQADPSAQPPVYTPRPKQPRKSALPMLIAGGIGLVFVVIAVGLIASRFSAAPDQAKKRDDKSRTKDKQAKKQPDRSTRKTKHVAKGHKQQTKTSKAAPKNSQRSKPKTQPKLAPRRKTKQVAQKTGTKQKGKQGTTSTVRLTLPGGVELASARVTVRRRLGQTLRAAKDAASRSQLAKQLVLRADMVKEASEKYATLLEARDLAVLATDQALLSTILNKLTNEFQLDEHQLRAETISKLVTETTADRALADLFTTIEDDIERAVEADKYEAALELCQAGTECATKTKDLALRRAALSTTRQVQSIFKAYEIVIPHLGTLQTNANDPAANGAVGKFLCFQKRDWEKGMGHLKKGTSLSELAAKELDPTTSPEELSAEWLKASIQLSGIEKDAARDRGVYWLRKEQRKAEETDRSKIFKKLRSLGQSYRLNSVDWRRGNPLRRRLLDKTQGFVFLTRIGGAFEGGGERLLLSVDTHWNFGGFAAKTIAGRATVLRIGTRGRFPGRVREYVWNRRSPGKIRMIHKSRGFCFLTSVAGAFEGGGESVRVTLEKDGYWYLSGHAQQSLGAHAISVQLVGIRRLEYEVKEHVWYRGKETVKMIRADEGFCFLNGISGAYEGMGEVVQCDIGPDGYWRLNGNAGKHIGCSAISIRMIGAWP